MSTLTQMASRKFIILQEFGSEKQDIKRKKHTRNCKTKYSTSAEPTFKAKKKGFSIINTVIKIASLVVQFP
jgi:hypothetical protein